MNNENIAAVLGTWILLAPITSFSANAEPCTMPEGHCGYLTYYLAKMNFTTHV
ncbi:hypothetical protein OK016_22225 [Vibrio chagasii]|nr:hypothetical protein [Vibrio chagasii]